MKTTKSKSTLRLGAALGAALLGLTLTTHAQEVVPTPVKDAKEPSAGYTPLFKRTPTLQLSDVPAAVRMTVEKQAAGRKIADIDREKWSGQTVYEVEFAQSGRNSQIHVAEDGTIVKPTKVGLKEAFMGTQLEDTPAAVQKTIRFEAGNERIVDIDKEQRDGKTVYEVEIAQVGKNVELHIGEDGTIVRDSRLAETRSRGDYVPLFERTPSLQLSDVPEAVRKTISVQAAGRKIADIDKETWSGRTVYEVEFAQTGRNAQIHVADDGSIVNAEGVGAAEKVDSALSRLLIGTRLEDTPTAVQATVKREAGAAQIVDIDKEQRSGQTVYEVEIKQPGKNVELHIAGDGTVLRDSRKDDTRRVRDRQP